MPCNGGNYFGTHYVNVGDPEDRKTIEHLTRMLCQCCDLASKAGAELPKELDEWWYEHRLADQERIAEAKRRAQAQEAAERREEYLKSVKVRVLEQLTDDEKEALGLGGQS